MIDRFSLWIKEHIRPFFIFNYNSIDRLKTKEIKKITDSTGHGKSSIDHNLTTKKDQLLGKSISR